MKHEMRLSDLPFESIKLGRKTVEMRLFDEKRSRICAGDTVVFTNANTGETLLCAVQAVRRYVSFEELYQNYDKQAIGYMENENADPKEMFVYYSQEQIERYGVVAIEIKREN